MLMDIEKLRKVQQAVDSTQTITTRFMYNHTWILSLMRTYARKKILRSDVIWFATNYIIFDRFRDKKAVLCQMLVSADWQKSRYARTGTERNHMKNFVTSQSFWQWTNKIVNATKPLYEVLQTVESERYPKWASYIT